MRNFYIYFYTYLKLIKDKAKYSTIVLYFGAKIDFCFAKSVLNIKCILFVLFIILICNIILPVSGCSPDNTNSLISKAAIIDQLGLNYPNEIFIERITGTLKQSGFNVDVFSGSEVNIDLYKKLPLMNYKLIIFRAHSGILNYNPLNPGIEGKTWLFTNEPYSTKYPFDQITDRITFGQTSKEASRYFTIGAKFVKESMEGKFHNTMIILMGCDSFHLTDLVSALIEKGASVCIGWDLSVELNYVDKSTIRLIDLLVQNFDIKTSVDMVNLEMGKSIYNATLQYYPEQKGKLQLKYFR